MNNTRRKFFGNLFKGIIVTSVAPSVIISKLGDHQIWKPSKQIITLPRKLKVTWTVELDQDLRAYHGIRSEDELARIVAESIRAEIDQDFLDRMRKIV